MIRAAAELKDGGTLLILGLEAANLERLTAGDSIHIGAEELDELRRHGEFRGLVIFAGTTRADIRAEWLQEGLIGPDTEEIALGPPKDRRRRPGPSIGGEGWRPH